MSLRLLCLPGDGIGPEIVSATEAVVLAACESAGVAVDLDRAEIGFAALDRFGITIPEDVITKARAADGVILGPVSHNDYPPIAQGGLNPSGVLRRELELFANIRPAISRAGVPTPTGHAVNMGVVRENLEGFKADRNMAEGGGEFSPVPGVALAMRKITEANSRAIARAGLAIAAERPAKKVAVIHKANVMRLSDGLFLSAVRDEARAYPNLQIEEVLVDAAAALMVRDPARFDVVIATNMFGDILSDLAAELAGGLGLAASLNHGATHAVAQAQHGSAPDIAGQDRANPGSLIASAAMLLRHRGQGAVAESIERALDQALSRPETRTTDLGGALGTRAFSQTLVDLIKGQTP
jgi:3-isopropylmalate dehydrogenase